MEIASRVGWSVELTYQVVQGAHREGQRGAAKRSAGMSMQ